MSNRGIKRDKGKNKKTKEKGMKKNKGRDKRRK